MTSGDPDDGPAIFFQEFQQVLATHEETLHQERCNVNDMKVSTSAATDPPWRLYEGGVAAGEAKTPFRRF